MNKIKLVKSDKSVVWQKCNGDAHKPEVAGNMDHCMVCLPYWGSYPVCPECGGAPKTKSRFSKKNGLHTFFYCPNCNIELKDEGERPE